MPSCGTHRTDGLSQRSLVVSIFGQFNRVLCVYTTLLDVKHRER